MHRTLKILKIQQNIWNPYYGWVRLKSTTLKLTSDRGFKLVMELKKEIKNFLSLSNISNVLTTVKLMTDCSHKFVVKMKESSPEVLLLSSLPRL